MKRTAIYGRVSTDKQDLERQLIELRDYVERSEDLELVGEYLEHESGATAADQRPELARLMDDCRRRKVDHVVVDAMSRLTRGGPREAFNLLDELDDLGVSFFDYSQPLLDTSNALVRNVFIAIRSTMDQIFLADLSRATKQGLAKVAVAEADPERRQQRREQGKQAPGRPRVLTDEVMVKACAMRATGRSYGQIAADLKISRRSAFTATSKTLVVAKAA